MAMRCVWALALLGCSEPSVLEHVDADADLVRPLELRGPSRYELWSVADVTTTNDAVLAHTRDGGASWLHIAVPQLRRSAPIQIAAHGRNTAWVVGAGVTSGKPTIVAITMLGSEPTVREHADVFPDGVTDVTLHAGGWNAEPMITARVPDAAALALYLLDDFTSDRWYRHPMPNIASLVSIYSQNAGYFTVTNPAPEPVSLVHCTLFAGSTHCFPAPLWTDRFDQLHGSVPTSEMDWLWQPDASGGSLLRRRGSEFEIHDIQGWPDDAEPIRFFGVKSGDIGIVARRDGELVWLALDEYARVTRQAPLAECDDCDAASVRLLPDASLLVPNGAGWYVGSVRGL